MAGDSNDNIPASRKYTKPVHVLGEGIAGLFITPKAAAGLADLLQRGEDAAQGVDGDADPDVKAAEQRAGLSEDKKTPAPTATSKGGSAPAPTSASKDGDPVKEGKGAFIDGKPVQSTSHKEGA
jgi:hypothetical protein